MPSQVSDRPTAVARVRSSSDTRLTTCGVRLLSTLPPLILLPGFSPSQEQNALALRQRLMFTPISEMMINTLNTFNPITWVKSTPQIRCNSALRSLFSPWPVLCGPRSFFFLGVGAAVGLGGGSSEGPLGATTTI